MAVMYTASEDLFFLPACHSQFLNIVRSGAISSASDQFHIPQQCTLRWHKARFVKLAFDDCFYTLIGCSLDPQEVGVAVQSIRTPVQIGDVAGDQFFVAARKMSLRRVEVVS
jgi:hypothetical protein